MNEPDVDELLYMSLLLHPRVLVTNVFSCHRSRASLATRFLARALLQTLIGTAFATVDLVVPHSPLLGLISIFLT